MKVRLKDGLVKVEMSLCEADSVRACLFREGRHPTSPSVLQLRSELYHLLHDDCFRPTCSDIKNDLIAALTGENEDLREVLAQNGITVGVPQ